MILPPAMARQLLEHCTAELPNEACGLVAGDESGIKRIYCLGNADASPVSFTIDPAGHFGALQDAERNGWDLIGAFHSHVDGPAYPSATDVERAAEPDWVWLVGGGLAALA